jgi:[ribosomal protein S5]-alanine N-acetyltransferase
LRQFSKDDADNLFALDSEPEVMRWGNGGNSCNYEVIKNQILPIYPATDSKFGVELNLVTDDEMALSYWFHKSSWNKGYATEGSRILISKSFTQWNISRVVSWTLLDNQASIHVMEKAELKFEKEFIFTETQLPNLKQSERNAVKYALNKEEFNLENYW